MKMKILTEFPAFKNWIKVLSTVGEERMIAAKEEGLYVIGMDPSHVAMIKTQFGKDLFDEYEAEEDDNVTINVEELFRILDRADKDEQVTIEKDVKQSRLLINLKKGTRIRRFKMHLIDDGDEEVPDPKIFFRSKTRITLDEFTLGLVDANLVSEHIVLTVTENLMKLSALGDMGDTMAQWDKDSEGILSLSAEEEAKATYTLSYVLDIVKAVKPLTEVLTIELSTDMPIRIEAECASPHIKAEFYLAPCIGV